MSSLSFALDNVPTLRMRTRGPVQLFGLLLESHGDPCYETVCLTKVGSVCHDYLRDLDLTIAFIIQGWDAGLLRHPW